MLNFFVHNTCKSYQNEANESQMCVFTSEKNKVSSLFEKNVMTSLRITKWRFGKNARFVVFITYKKNLEIEFDLFLIKINFNISGKF